MQAYHDHVQLVVRDDELIAVSVVHLRAGQVQRLVRQQSYHRSALPVRHVRAPDFVYFVQLLRLVPVDVLLEQLAQLQAHLLPAELPLPRGHILLYLPVEVVVQVLEGVVAGLRALDVQRVRLLRLLAPLDLELPLRDGLEESAQQRGFGRRLPERMGGDSSLLLLSPVSIDVMLRFFDGEAKCLLFLRSSASDTVLSTSDQSLELLYFLEPDGQGI